MESAFKKSLTVIELQQYFAEESMLPLLSVLSSPLFVGTRLIHDFYSTFYMNV